MPKPTPTPITLGSTVNGSLTYRERVSYSFELFFEQDLRIFLDGLTLRDTYLRIYDSNNWLFAGDDDSGGNADSLVQRTFPAGRYTIEAAGYGPQFQGTFALSVTSLLPAVNKLSSTIGTDTGRTPTVQSNGVTRDNTVLLSGTREAGTTVAIYDGETLLSSSANGGPAWQVQGASWRFLSSALGEGMHNLSARFIGADTRFTTQSVSLFVDTLPTGTLSPVILTDTGSTSAIVSNGSTSDRTLGLRGTADMGSVVQIYDGTRLLGTVETGYNSYWAFTTPSLKNGNHTLSARITDLAGNTWQSSTLSVAVTAFTGPRTIDVGQTVGDELDVGQRIRYTLNMASAQNLSIFLDGQSLRDAYLRIYDSNNRLIALNDDGGGNLDSKINRMFSAGVYSVEAGSYADRSSGTFALSVTALSPPAVLNALSNTIGTNTGSSTTIQSGGQTKDKTVTLSGTLASGTTITIFDGASLLASSFLANSAWTFSGDKWSYTTDALSDGPHTLRAEFSAAGTTTQSKSVTLTIDTLTSGTLSNVITTNNGSTPSIGGGGTTTDDTLELTGTAEAGSVVQIYDGTTLLGNATLSATNWTFTTPALALGTHALFARVTDKVGNTADTPSKAVTITAPASGFSIDLVYTGDAAYQSYFAEAAARWAEVIVGDLPDIDEIDDLRIAVSVDYIDGPGGQLGAGSPTLYRTGLLDWGLPYEGEINLESEDIPALIANGTFLDLVIHEIGHVLGFGSLFENAGLLEPSDPLRYVGANALARYAQLTGTNPDYIPLENYGGEGTVGGHWAEDVFGNELMTGYTNDATSEPLSAMTLGALADMGYTVDYSKATPYSIGASGATAKRNVVENTSASVPAYTPADSGLALSYALLPGADADKFNIDPTTGAVTFKAAPDFENPLSALLSNSYSLQVRANYSSTFSVDRTVKITVTDTDEEAPTFTRGDNVSVNFAENRTGSVYTPTATDNVMVTLYTIGGGADAAKFTINVVTGAIRFKQSPDYETPASQAGNNTYVVQIRAEDRANNYALQTVTVNVTDVAETALSFASSTASASVTENLAVSSAAYQAQATGSASAPTYALSGPDAALFTVNSSTGQVYFKASPDHESPMDAGRDNGYNFTLTAQGSGGASATQNVTLTVTDVAAPATTQAFSLWQQAEQAAQGDATKDIQAYNQFNKEVVQERDDTSRDGLGNQQFASKRLTQWVDQVTGTDIVSDAEYDSGFSITGKADSGAQGSIKFRLDNDRTTGADGEGAAVLDLGANDVNGDGTTDVTASYDNTTGEWSLAFAAGSAALLQATRSVAGSGVHQLVVDTDGSGIKGSAEASRLFLVASGTASNTDTGTAAQNYSVQDRLSKDVFVYYYGDPDGDGIGMITRLDNGDPVGGVGDTVMLDKDGVASDFDYYNTEAAHAALPLATASNTALHFATDIAAQTWEFHIAQYGASQKTFSAGNALATDHISMNSNASRLASLEEALALYAGNFLYSTSTTAAGSAGPIEPISNSSANTNGSSTATAAENNRPNGWTAGSNWTAAATPTGHAHLDLTFGEVKDWSNGYTASVMAVL